MTCLNQLLRYLFFIFLVRPIVRLIIGLNYHNPVCLPKSGPAIIVANHNSHLDTMVLISMLPLKLLHKVQPVAAADYFLSNPFKAWFAKNIIGILPIARQGEHQQDPIAECVKALEQKKILIFFPEGSRGEPEAMNELKFGIAKLAQQKSKVPVYPIFLHGLGKALPKGQFVLVPFFCDVAFGTPLYGDGEKTTFISALKAQFHHLQSTIKVPSWE